MTLARGVYMRDRALKSGNKNFLKTRTTATRLQKTAEDR